MIGRFARMIKKKTLRLSIFQNHDNRLFFMTSNDKTRDASTAVSSSTTPKYSTTDRNCKTIPIAPAHRLDLDEIFTDPDDKPNLEILKQHLLLEGRVTERAALRIIEIGKNKRRDSIEIFLFSNLC